KQPCDPAVGGGGERNDSCGGLLDVSRGSRRRTPATPARALSNSSESKATDGSRGQTGRQKRVALCAWSPRSRPSGFGRAPSTSPASWSTPRSSARRWRSSAGSASTPRGVDPVARRVELREGGECLPSVLLVEFVATLTFLYGALMGGAGWSQGRPSAAEEES